MSNHSSNAPVATSKDTKMVSPIDDVIGQSNRHVVTTAATQTATNAWGRYRAATISTAAIA